MEKKCGELRHENERMKNTLARFEEHETQLQKRVDEKMHENTQLSSMLEQVYVQFGDKNNYLQILKSSSVQDKGGFRSTSGKNEGAMRNHAKINARPDCRNGKAIGTM